MKKVIVLLIIVALMFVSLACGDTSTVDCRTRVYNECMTIGNPDTCMEMVKLTCGDEK